MENNYIKSLVTPVASKGTTRRVKSFDVDMLVEFGYAQNIEGNTSLPLEALGAPYRLAVSKDGEVKFSSTGRPSVRVAKEIVSFGTTIHQNIVSMMQAETVRVFKEKEEAVALMKTAAAKAAAPILNSDVKRLDAALAARAKAEAEKAASDAAAGMLTDAETKESLDTVIANAEVIKNSTIPNSSINIEPIESKKSSKRAAKELAGVA